MSVAWPGNAVKTEASVPQDFFLRHISWRRLGHECPSYWNRSFDESDFGTDFDDRIVDFLDRGERHASACRYTELPAVCTRAKNRRSAGWTFMSVARPQWFRNRMVSAGSRHTARRCSAFIATPLRLSPGDSAAWPRLRWPMASARRRGRDSSVLPCDRSAFRCTAA